MSMRELLLVLLALALVWCLVVASAVTLTVVAARRVSALVSGLARTRGRELSETTRIRLSGYGTGDRAQAARLRRELRENVVDTRRTMDAAAAAGWAVGDAPALVRRLETVAAELDTQLRLLTLDRRPGDAGTRLPELESRVATVVASCTDLRCSLRERPTWIDDDLDRLREDCRIEAQALDQRPNPSGSPRYLSRPESLGFNQ
jgi:hypothetical protein